MADVTLDQALPAIQNLAERKAMAFVRRCRLAIDEREDVESQLVLIFISRWPKFDGERACVRTFASRVMDKEIATIMRFRLAGRRRHVECEEFIRDQDGANSGEDSLTGRSTTPRILREQRHFWLDVERALFPLPEVLLETAYDLCWYTPTELSRVRGRSRTIIYERIRRIREALLAAGIGPDYFATSGRVQ